MKKTLLVILVSAMMLISNNICLAQPSDLKAQQDKVNQIKQTQQGKQIMSLVDKYSKQYKVDPKFVKAIILVESGFNPKATSSHGAKGLMQMMDNTFYARQVGKNPYDMEQNIHAGVKHIAGLSAKYKGNMYYVASAYNCGGGNVDSSLKKYGRLPKYTSNYVYRVQSYKQLITF